MSFPHGLSINDFISKDEYFGEKIKVVYPKVDDFVDLIKVKGQCCYEVDKTSISMFEILEPGGSALGKYSI